MSSSDYFEDLKAYFDGELPQARADEVRQALDSDSELRAEYEFIAQASHSLRSMTLGPVPAAPRPANRRKLVPALAIAVSCCVVVFASVALLRSTRGGADSAPNFATNVDMPPVKVPGFRSQDGFANGQAKESAQSGGKFGVDGRTETAKASSAGAAADLSDSDSSTAKNKLDRPAGERSIIRTADLHLRVSSVSETENKITHFVKSISGFVESSTSDENRFDPTADISVRVPAAAFDRAIQELSKYGVRLSKTVNGEDVTKQVVDNDARLRNLRVQEETYRKILGNAKTVGQVLEVESEIAEVRMQIETLTAEQKELVSRAQLSEISIHLSQSAEAAASTAHRDDNWAGEAWGTSVRTLGSALRSIGTACIYAFTFAPIWLPCLAVLALFTKLALRWAKA